VLDSYKLPTTRSSRTAAVHMPTAVKQEPELRAIGLHEEKKPSLLYSKSRPAPSPAVRPASLNTPPPEYTLPPPPTYNYSDTAFDHKTPLGSRTLSSSENGSRRGSRAMGSISGKGMLINPGLSRAKLVDCASKVSLPRKKKINGLC
jgi:hypothetical protein